MELLDARRLTGPNLLFERAGSVLDVRCSNDDAESLISVWESCVNKMLDAVGWKNEIIAARSMLSGVSLAFSAPIDLLYTATAINEWAWACCEAQLSNRPFPDFDQSLIEISASISEEANPQLPLLELAAETNDVTLLWDDDEVTLGLGKTSETWPFRELPDPASLDWNRLKDIPIGIITGTNGKTTTVRLVHHILRAAKYNVAISSTDWIAVNEDIIDRGDWSGPGGARQVLRQKNVDVAVLESARGGLLRRGLGVGKAQVAMITNVSEDHLGDFGSETVSELLDIKWIISQAVVAHGALVLNADDKLLVEKSKGYPGRIVWFSLHAENSVIADHIQEGGVAYIVDGEYIVCMAGSDREMVCAVDQIPITMGGFAKHNIANALAAAAMCEQFGISMPDIRQGLQTMSQAKNPGRSNVYKIKDVNVLVDFAHNPAAMKAIFEVAQALPANRRLLSFGQAGDRPDDLIRELAQCAWSIGLDAVIVSELAIYHRGRSHGEVFDVIKNELIRLGMLEDQIKYFDEELDSLQSALEWAEPGDLIIMLALADKELIQEKLESLVSLD